MYHHSPELNRELFRGLMVIVVQQTNGYVLGQDAIVKHNGLRSMAVITRKKVQTKNSNKSIRQYRKQSKSSGKYWQVLVSR